MELSGSLSGLGVRGLLHLLERSRQTGRVCLRQGRWTGELEVVDGRPVLAVLGQEAGSEALALMARAFSHASFTFAARPPLDDDASAVPLQVDEAALDQPAGSTPLLDRVPRLGEPHAETGAVKVDRRVIALLREVDGRRTVDAIAAWAGLGPTLRGLDTLAELGLIEFAPTPSRPAGSRPAAAPRPASARAPATSSGASRPGATPPPPPPSPTSPPSPRPRSASAHPSPILTGPRPSPVARRILIPRPPVAPRARLVVPPPPRTAAPPPRDAMPVAAEPKPAPSPVGPTPVPTEPEAGPKLQDATPVSAEPKIVPTAPGPNPIPVDRAVAPNLDVPIAPPLDRKPSPDTDAKQAGRRGSRASPRPARCHACADAAKANAEPGGAATQSRRGRGADQAPT